MNRRNFIKNTGCLAIGFSISGSFIDAPSPMMQELPESIKRHPNINAWLEVLANGQVRIFTGKLELGQGISTAISQVAAEELDLTMENVEIVLADTLRTPDEGYTVGSGSIEQSAMAVRFAAAAARHKLLELAAQQLNVSVDQLTMKEGKISTITGDRSITFNQLLNGKQITDKIQAPVTLKPKENYKLVGKAIPRNDINRMVRGEQFYIQDLRFPGMVYASIVRPPAYEAKLLHLDEKALQKNIPGILKTVVNGSFIGVIAKEEYQAIKAQRWLQKHSKWSAGTQLPAGTDLVTYLKTLPVQTKRDNEKGSMPTDTSSFIKAQYFKPYHMHASIGPSCAVGIYENGRLHVWSHSQGIFPLRESLAKLLQLKIEQIDVTGVPGSGCYGHNGADDAAADVALLAMAYPGKHIRLQWTREEEHAWEPYGSAMIMEVAAVLDSSGKINSWQYDLWSDTHSTRPGGNANNLLAAQYYSTPLKEKQGFSGGGFRNSEPYYSFPNYQVNGHMFKGPLRTSALRSLGAYANVFAIESFMDELAEKAGKDPFTFRLMHLTDERAKAVIRKVQELIADVKQAANTGIGIAFSRYKNSAAYCAVAAQVQVQPKEGTIKVQKMWAAIDAGEVINIDGLINQTEGGMIQSASWTIMEQVRFDAQHISSRDWVSYPIMRFSQIPEVEVAVLNQPNEKAMGAGEAAQGPAAAAIANAVYKVGGKRIRHLPLHKR
ncbi:xanthine dehydrogenase family protein molybdopterin-binding subunit [Niastella caeni]|uniref:Xanthine dehydrogenase family protein molybdopterin-binding subunit n=1 Tax=Niastella caeni TaxID=2569763 RepID=A0A4S8HRF3_9BACT|nr:molybdopterin cofactor-binding domain-containing protein [Niastella caeni]THU37109.1 xanthine dehydrogenase family protein molybdopterin-binding subunit [Niastella caeni]